MTTMTKTFGETKAGKKVGVKPAPNTTLLHICFEGGGQLPSFLGGLWTEPQAKRQIELYLAKDAAKKSKEDK